MSKIKQKSVWIIGAGFSRHAGGPLLNDLFSETADAFLEADDAQNLNRLLKVALLYRNHRLSTVTARYGMPLWTNVEEFLEKIDSMSNSENPNQVLDNLVNEVKCFGINNGRDLCRCAFARICKEVEDYVQQIPKHSERLSPYLHWVARLEAQDIVISFNYDTLVETSAKYAECQLNTPTPNGTSLTERPTLLKLHGSVSWSREPIEPNIIVLRHSYNESPVGETSRCSPVIATPGASKGQFVNDFSALWKIASDAIENADYIHIVGYRFPESDSAAILNLLNPMRQCGNATKVNIVLGTDLTRPDVIRVYNMVQRNLPYAIVTLHPLFAQDYMTLDNTWKDPDIGPLFLS